MQLKQVTFIRKRNVLTVFVKMRKSACYKICLSRPTKTLKSLNFKLHDFLWLDNVSVVKTVKIDNVAMLVL